MNKKALGVVIAISMISLLSLGCGKVNSGSTDVKRPNVSGITVTAVNPVTVGDYYETAGTVTAKTTSLVASKVMGTVNSVRVNAGDRVSAGQTLMTIDVSELGPKAAAAQAGYQEALKALQIASKNQELAGVTYERYKQLYDEKAITKQEFDQVATKKHVSDLELERLQEIINRAQAGVAEVEVYQGFTQITAPGSGIVTAKKLDIGSLAMPGTPLFSIEDDSVHSIEVDVDESLLNKLALGMEVEIKVESGGYQSRGIITELNGTIDPASRKFHLKISAADANLQSGSYAKVYLPVGSKEAILLPKAVVVVKGQLAGVYTVDNNNVITYRVIRAGKQYGDQLEILSGLNTNDKVITDGLDKVVDGGVVNEVKTE